MSLFNLKNLFGTSPQQNPYVAVAGVSAGVMHGSMPIGLMNGHMMGHANHNCMQASNWLKTLNSGTIVTADGDPTTIVLTTAASAHTGPQAQYSKDNGTTAWAPFVAQAGKALWFRKIIKVSDATNTALVIGLCNVDTTLLNQATDAIDFTDGIFLYKAAGAVSVAGVLRKASTSTSQTLTSYDFADDTYKDIGIRITDGGQCVEFWIDGTKVYTQTTLTNIPTASLALSVAINTTAASAKTATIKRAMAFKEAA